MSVRSSPALPLDLRGSLVRILTHQDIQSQLHKHTHNRTQSQSFIYPHSYTHTRTPHQDTHLIHTIKLTHTHTHKNILKCCSFQKSFLTLALGICNNTEHSSIYRLVLGLKLGSWCFSPDLKSYNFSHCRCPNTVFVSVESSEPGNWGVQFCSVVQKFTFKSTSLWHNSWPGQFWQMQKWTFAR